MTSTMIEHMIRVILSEEPSELQNIHRNDVEGHAESMRKAQNPNCSCWKHNGTCSEHKA